MNFVKLLITLVVFVPGCFILRGDTSVAILLIGNEVLF